MLSFTDTQHTDTLHQDYNQWFVSGDGGKSWENHALGTPPDTANTTTSLVYLVIDRFANMVAVGRAGLVYSISGQSSSDSDEVSFVWSKRLLSLPAGTNESGVQAVQMTGASAFNKTHFVVVGKNFGVGGGHLVGVPQSLVAMSVSKIQDGGGGMQSSRAALPEDARGVTAVYTPSIWTSVVATDSGKFFHSNDMTNTWNSTLVPWLVQKDT